MIHVTGDTHGEQNRFLYIEKKIRIKAGDVLIVCGDFGYLFDNDLTENNFLDDINKRGYTICFVDGNHENFSAIFEYPEEIWNGGRIHRIRENIIHLMRGQVFEIEGKKIFTMGGAYSIDRPYRKLGKSYWEEEIPTWEECSEGIQSLRRHGMQVDYILTHTMPREMINRYGRNFDLHDAQFTGFLEWVMYECRFRHWYCGHWHDDVDIDSRFTILFHNVVTLE